MSTKDNIEPAGGFEEGDWIVVAGQAGLKDQVALRQAETKDAPDASMGFSTRSAIALRMDRMACLHIFYEHS